MGVIRVAIFLLWWYRVPWPMVPRWNLGPRVCCSHTIVPLGARWYLGMCECDSTTLSFSCNPYNYPSPMFLLRSTALNYLEEASHMCIASWLLKQESTQIMNNLEQECLEQNFVWYPSAWSSSLLQYSAMRKTPHQFLCQNPTVPSLTRYLFSWQVNLAGNAPSSIVQLSKRELT